MRRQAKLVGEQQLALVRRADRRVPSWHGHCSRKEPAMVAAQGAQQHHEVVDLTTSTRPKVLMVVANPTVSTTTGWPVGFWAGELPHPYFEFTRVRYDV